MASAAATAMPTPAPAADPALDGESAVVRLDAAAAERVARTLQALATPSRLMILSRLRQGACAATELAAEVGMEQSACSHQLRVLRRQGLVTGERHGRSVVYALYDAHVCALLDQAIYHVGHVGVDRVPPRGSGAHRHEDAVR